MKVINRITGKSLELTSDAEIYTWISSCSGWEVEDSKDIEYVNDLLRVNSFKFKSCFPIMDINLENCYGIRKLSYRFDFEDGKPYSIYAPNGFMKTSFAKTLSDLQNRRVTCDEIYSKRITKREVIGWDNRGFSPDSVYVIPPYQENFKSTGVSTLLVNSQLKSEYEEAINRVDSDLKSIDKALKLHSGLNKGNVTPLSEILKVFSIENEDKYKFFSDAKDLAIKNPLLTSIDYKVIFNDNVEKYLMSGDLKDDINEYIEQYQKLTDKSEFLSRDFSHVNASDTSLSLENNGYFKASHSLNLKVDGSMLKISTKAELDDLIQSEKDKIFSDKILADKVKKLDIDLGKNASLKKFREYLLDNQSLISELSDFNSFKKKYWLNLFSIVLSDLEIYSANFKRASSTIQSVSLQAVEEKTKWEKVVDIFNNRFHVPFIVSVDNQKGVILNNEEPVVLFGFKEEGEEKISVSEGDLLKVLSLGEKRALYILNILFDINARREADVNTVFIVDDIADSFDYKNKYAIIEYFKELSETKDFNFIFLTHNFDFHRTISSRLDIPAEKGLFCTKRSKKIELEQDKYRFNPFSSWKESLDSSPLSVIACIPFVRNICEYTRGEGDDYKDLTALLHIKSKTENITIKNLEDIYKKVLIDKPDLKLIGKSNDSVYELILSEAHSIFNKKDDSASLETKVAMSIAIRLLAERHMIDRINNKVVVKKIVRNQTISLYQEYVKTFPNEEVKHSLLAQVNLMTPENIHLNSFMYEPILDMSSLRLYDLYKSIKGLN